MESSKINQHNVLKDVLNIKHRACLCFNATYPVEPREQLVAAPPELYRGKER